MRMFLLAVLVVTVILVVLVGCRSMTKAEVESRVRGLSKNQGLASLPLQESTVKTTLDGQIVGLRSRWYEMGEKNKGLPRLVFIHGTPAVPEHWVDLVLGPGQLARDHEVYLLEIVGHGAAPTELSHTTFQACADQVRSFLERQDLRDVTLVGHSYGGEFAWRAALDAPERVSKLVLIDSSGPPRRDGEWMSEEEKMREWSVARYGWLFSTPGRVESALAIHFPGPIPVDRLEEMYLACANSHSWNAMVDLCRDENGQRFEELSKLQAQTLLLWGAQDIAYKPERFLKEFQRVLPQAKTMLVEGAGHYPHDVFPGKVAEAIREFARP
jgi:pimeloyl-ACP methyl ester carboxylesterase